MTRIRKPGAVRKDEILQIAMALAINGHYLTVKRPEIAARLGCAERLVNYYFRDMVGLQSAIVQRAISQRVYPIIAQALISGHPDIVGIDAELKKQTLEYYR